MAYQIRSPFLRLFFQVYGHLSVQLYPYHLNSFQNKGTLIWNGALFLLTTCKFLNVNASYLSETKSDPQMRQTFAEKPLLAMLYNLAMRNDFQVVYLLNAAYFATINCNTSKLVRLLDSFDVSPFNDRSRSLRLFACALAVHQIVYLLSQAQTILWLIEERLWLEIFLQYTLLIPLNVNLNLVFLLLYYYKYATLRTLQLMRHQLQCLSSRSMLRQVEREIAHLALTNFQLNGLLSFPLMIGLIPFVLEWIITFSCLLFKRLTWENVYLLELVLHLFSLAVLETTTHSTLHQIGQLLECHTQSIYRLPSKSIPSSEYFYLLRSRSLLSLYQHYFPLRLFSLCTINWAFAFTAALFIINYIVLVAQTSS